MNTTDTRAAFEAWAESGNGSYTNAWAAWQAATEAAKPTGTAEEQAPMFVDHNGETLLIPGLAAFRPEVAPAQDLSAAMTAKQCLEPETIGAEWMSESGREVLADWIEKQTASSADALSAGDRVDAVKTGTLYQAIQRAAGELPDDYTIRIEIEQGSAVVEMAGADCEWVLVDGNDGYLCQAVNAATDRAILQSQKGGSHG